MYRDRKFLRRLAINAVVIFSFGLSGCSGFGDWFSAGDDVPETPKRSETIDFDDDAWDPNAVVDGRAGPNDGGFFSGGGSGLVFGDTDSSRGGVIGVNSFLWRASLDTISFLPIKSADAFGGVIITDWHSPAGSPNERFKLNVYILDRALRADGIRVGVFRQVLDRNGKWRDAKTANKTALKIEDAILTRARQLRLRTAKNN